MENVVSLDNARLLDNYKKILNEKKHSDESTVTEIRAVTRRKVTDGISVKNIEDIKNILKELLPILAGGFQDKYEQEKSYLLPSLCVAVGLKDTPQSRHDLALEISKIEKILVKEFGDLLGIDEQGLSHIEALSDRYVVVYDSDVCIDLHENGRVFKLPGLKLKHSDMRIYVGKKDFSAPAHMLEYGLFRVVDGFTNDPRLPTPLIVKSHPMKTTYDYNKWIGFKKEIIQAPKIDHPEKYCPMVLRLLWQYGVSEYKEQYDLLLNYMAHMVQKPWEKPGWAVLLHGKEGSGKDTIARILGKMIHHTQWIEIGDHEFKDRHFNDWRNGRLLVNVTEFTGLPTKDTAHVYQIIEAPEARISTKYLPTYTTKSIERVILTSNNPEAIKAKADTRRFFVPTFNDEMGMDHGDNEERKAYKRNYWNTLYAEIGTNDVSIITPAIIAFYQHLLARDISSFNVKDPKLETHALEEMIESNQSTLEIFVDNMIYAEEIPDYVGFEPPFKLSSTEQTIIRGEEVNKRYEALFQKAYKRGEYAHPRPGQFCRYLIKELGLTWEEGPAFKNNHMHYKYKDKSLHYFFPPLPALRNAYFKKYPNKRRPTP